MFEEKRDIQKEFSAVCHNFKALRTIKQWMEYVFDPF